MKITQHELPFNAGKEQAVVSWGGHLGWFYIENRNAKHKVLYADERGNYYYGEKDLSHCVPVVWNNRKAAMPVARRHGGRVRKYPYQLAKR